MSEAATVTLTEFITARLDERVREIAELRELADSIGRVYGSPAPPEDDMRLGDIVYFALHAEADRVLREVEAMRRIVDAYREERSRRNIYQSDSARAVEDDEQKQARRSSAARCRGLEIAVEALASIWADHSDYREEWA